MTDWFEQLKEKMADPMWMYGLRIVLVIAGFIIVCLFLGIKYRPVIPNS